MRDVIIREQQDARQLLHPMFVYIGATLVTRNSPEAVDN